MLRKVYIALTLCIVFVGFSIFYSCSKVEHDNVNPAIVNIFAPVENAIVPLDSYYVFNAKFIDNKGLSSYFVKVWDPEINEDSLIVKDPDGEEYDSLAVLNKVFQTVSIFGDTVANVRHTFFLDSIQSIRGKQYPARTGKYQFKVVVMDIDGNRDSTMFDIQVVKPVND